MAVGLFATAASAQWVQQQFPLVAGWNAVHLEVDPSPAESNSLWSALPISAVWTRDELAGAAAATMCSNPDDPSCIPPDDPGWRVWVPPMSPHAVVNSLGLVQGGRVYLIRASSAFTWTVTGRPSATPARWIVGANLVGFHVVNTPASTPTFSSYLSPFLSLVSGTVLEIRSDGGLQGVTTPASTRIVPGKGYWVRSTRAGNYDGPVEIDRGSLRGIDFAKQLTEHALTIGSFATSARTITVTQIASAPVPVAPPNLPELAGMVPLLWQDYDTNAGNLLFPWRDFNSQAFSLAAAGQPASRRTLRLAVDRLGLSSATVNPDGVGSQYESILAIADGAGFQRWVAVSAQVASGAAGQTAGAEADGPVPGLYVGIVTVNAVSWVTAGARQWINEDPVDPVILPGQPDDTTTVRPTATEFALPVIIHVNSSGMHRMLHEVITMWQPEAPPKRTEGRFVLVTPECPPAVRATLQAGSVRDGEPFSHRLSTAGFYFSNAQGLDADLVLSGSLASSLTGTTILRDNHRLNPFRHLYHPDHDCNEAGECFDIARTFTLTPTAQPEPGEFRPGQGESYFTGTYAETITGLYRGAIHVRGSFRLTRVSQIATLNAQ